MDFEGDVNKLAHRKQIRCRNVHTATIKRQSPFESAWNRAKPVRVSDTFGSPLMPSWPHGSSERLIQLVIDVSLRDDPARSKIHQEKSWKYMPFKTRISAKSKCLSSTRAIALLLSLSPWPVIELSITLDHSVAEDGKPKAALTESFQPLDRC